MNRALVACTIAALLCSASAAFAQQAFKTPDEAASALASAAKAGDMKALATVLGPDGEDIVSSGDEVADTATREKFVAAYDARHRIAMESDDKAIMVIGPDDFPVPIPLVRKGGEWRFDTAAGRGENLFRRISVPVPPARGRPCLLQAVRFVLRPSSRSFAETRARVPRMRMG